MTSHFMSPTSRANPRSSAPATSGSEAPPGRASCSAAPRKKVVKGEAQRIEPKPGDDVFLTIDTRIQFILEGAPCGMPGLAAGPQWS